MASLVVSSQGESLKLDSFKQKIEMFNELLT